MNLSALAATEHLLIVSDFDGTLAGIVPDPSAVPVDRDGLAALARLAELPSTTVAVLSGRGLDDLKSVCSLREPVVLAGSHGAESGTHGIALTREMAAALDAVDAQLSELAVAPAYVERKPFQRVLHVAPMPPVDGAALLTRAASIDPAGTSVQPGKNILEFSAAAVTKGNWIAAERDRVGATAVVFIGDDVTDENGFAALSSGDLGVKVGPGGTSAGLRVDDIPGVAAFLGQLARARASACH